VSNDLIREIPHGSGRYIEGAEPERRRANCERCSHSLTCQYVGIKYCAASPVDDMTDLRGLVDVDDLADWRLAQKHGATL